MSQELADMEMAGPEMRTAVTRGQERTVPTPTAMLSAVSGAAIGGTRKTPSKSIPFDGPPRRPGSRLLGRPSAR